MNKTPESHTNAEKDPSKEKENRQRLIKLGLQCVSPGLGNMDGRMLSTMQMSRDIAKDQKGAIQRLSERQKDVIKNSSDVPEEAILEQVQQTPNAIVSGSGDLEANASRTSSKSLKRRRIPPPLKICSNGIESRSRSTASKGHGHMNAQNGARSAPAHTTRHPRGRARVQYLGRPTESDPRIQRKPRLTHWSALANANAAPFTPYGYYAQPPPTAMGYQMGHGPIQNSYQMPYMIAPVPYTVLQPPFPNTSIPGATLQQDFETYRNQNPGVGTRDLFGNSESRWAPFQAQPQSARDEFFGSKGRQTPVMNPAASARRSPKEASKMKPAVAKAESDNEEVDLAIEEGAEPTGDTRSTHMAGTTMDGELRLQNDSFGFSFSLLEAATDKKMFMSICDKVWDDFQALPR
ncbi:LADA_0D05600g1_1 [Lachancea dasiensis]|uniref:LADA_0D05600g1_1 n=1 Tax=Lachancea dasiensis TaxID=1072105 RepID=A0A1G4J5S3_9SACH|nr:LADA_0D05600g1_1 [Lachancea dasiensis]